MWGADSPPLDFSERRVKKRTWPRWNGLSVLASTTAIVRPSRHVRFVPLSEVAAPIRLFRPSGRTRAAPDLLQIAQPSGVRHRIGW
jgi:hypothetical protein